MFEGSGGTGFNVEMENGLGEGLIVGDFVRSENGMASGAVVGSVVVAMGDILGAVIGALLAEPAPGLEKPLGLMHEGACTGTHWP